MSFKFNIAGICNVCVDERVYGFDEIKKLAEAVAYDSFDKFSGPDIEINACLERKCLSGYRELYHGFYIKQEELYDKKYGVNIKVKNNVVIVDSYKSPLEWLMWLVQIVLLNKGYTFIHGAGVATDNNEAMLFPSWGGVGKTAILAHYAKKDFKIVGDDLIILGSQGKVKSFAKPMVVYPYHDKVFPDLFKSGGGPKAPKLFNKLLSKVAIVVKPILRLIPGVLDFARKNNPQSKRVSPAVVFGEESIMKNDSLLKTAYWLEREVGIKETVESVLDCDDMAGRIIGSTINEFDQRVTFGSNILSGLGVSIFSTPYEKWNQILTLALYNKKNIEIAIPTEISVENVPYEVDRIVT